MTKFINKESCFIDKDVIIGDNVIIYENNHIHGNTQIDDNTVLLPGNYIINSSIGKDCQIHNSVIEESIIEDNVKIGPYAHLRPKCIIKSNCKIGNFVEIKNSLISEGCKISHLAYVGDATLGENCNVGCGVIFANYDGKNKSKTIVGRHVFIGSNSNLIAPLTLGDDTYICAGTTVTKNTLKNDFVIGRARQENKQNRATKYWNE